MFNVISRVLLASGNIICKNEVIGLMCLYPPKAITVGYVRYPLELTEEVRIVSTTLGFLENQWDKDCDKWFALVCKQVINFLWVLKTPML